MTGPIDVPTADSLIFVDSREEQQDIIPLMSTLGTLTRSAYRTDEYYKRVSLAVHG